MSRVTAIISALVISIIVCLSWAVNHYRDNAITYKAQRDKNARISYERRQLLTCRCVVRDVAALDAKYTKELADVLKLKMMFRVMMLPLVVVGCTSKCACQSKCAYHAHAVRIMQPPPDWQTPLNLIISPQERLITMQNKS